MQRFSRWAAAWVLGFALLLAGCGARPAFPRAEGPPPPGPPLGPAALGGLLPAAAPQSLSLPTPTPPAPPTLAPPTPASPESPPQGDGAAPVEVPVVNIALAGPVAQRNAELSGLAWYGDTLVLLPQYPTFTRDGQSAVYGLARRDLLAYLDAKEAGQEPAPLQPAPIAFSDWGVVEALPGFEGYEALAFAGERVFVTSEVTDAFGTAAYLIGGVVDADAGAIALDANTLTYIGSQAGFFNMSDEALIVTPEGSLLTLHEVNGAALNPAPIAHHFDPWYEALEPVPFPNIEYRITDATELDAEGRFWATNYFFPSDEHLIPAADPIAAEYGQGATHSQRAQVERLLEFQYDGARIVRTATPPVQLALTLLSRNWEGIVRLEERNGFLLVTDQFPETVLGFVAR